ncbi:hypothetical protein Poli38472_006362 [Pythium oligandrum]|uniref:BTB domain-containing protein n=1 Tax=Pythium oligandrum TaxID=41045 RepID=A0A8K1C5A4_PYTOL|nr:hypothetical protein Poli38472_006362 [Pythium oligandrum]|eukprot:TMW56352.1 hypothetical protein Poli38472_006362 [Pythium oligandrum]
MEMAYAWGDGGGVFTFGQNSYGELGHGDVNDRKAPTKVEVLEEEDVVDAACGNEQTTVLCGDGQVFACGYNDSGQCGTGATERVLRPTRIAALSDKRITRIFAGNGCEHLAAVSDAGALYTFGFNSRGQLGLGTTTSVSTPTLVEELVGKRVVEVACSYFHTVILTVDGELFACGRNDFGQLGLGDSVDRHVPTLVSQLGDETVRAVSSGQHHTVVATTEGNLFGFGKNDHGQLGVGSFSSPFLSPTKIATLPETTVIQSLACGYYHTVCVADDGTVYSFGRNDYGQLGLGHKRHTPTPSLVDTLGRMRVVQVACGCYHTLALSDDGKVYPFGRNNHGQLGLETSQDCVTPQIIPSLRDVHVKKVAAGFYHSVCLIGLSDEEARRLDGRKKHTLSLDLRRMLNNPSRSDVKFIVDGVPLYAHGCIIMARCEPLDKMLDGRTKDGTLSEIVIPDCSAEAFTALLEFLYTDEVGALGSPNVDIEFLLELLSLADQYLVTGLERKRIFETHSDYEDAVLRLFSITSLRLSPPRVSLTYHSRYSKKCSYSRRVKALLYQIRHSQDMNEGLNDGISGVRCFYATT